MFIMKKYNNNALNPDSHTKYIKKISYGKIQYGYPKKKKKNTGKNYRQVIQDFITVQTWGLKMCFCQKRNKKEEGFF